MNISQWAKRFSAMIFLLGLVLTASAQVDKKPYSEWNEKEAMKVLNDSAWSQTQTLTDTSNVTGVARADSSQSRIAEVININYRVRFFSAKPVRQAFSRMVELQQQGKVNEQLAAQLQALANAEFPDYVIVTVLVDSPTPSQKVQQATAAFYKLTTAELKNSTYLVTKGGQRIFLHEYQPPRKDGFGARFIFPRLVDGEPYLNANSGELAFHSEIPGITTLNTRYKVKEMMFGGKLEY